MCDVGCKQVVHLVGQWSLEHELGEGGGVADGEVEECGAAHPVHDLGEGEGRQQVLSKTLCTVHYKYKTNFFMKSTLSS